MSAPEWFIDNVPLDPDRLESIRARAVQGYAPTMRDTLNLLAEVERLRAESVPRSALVQVGWDCHVQMMPNYDPTGPCPIHHKWRKCQPVYVIREDTDGR